ncbi:MAG: hypothetical protein GY913_18990 [Proteobacteria bacterium]|nr:hypothetical protein [Pseudomonadota bacterium]MCP4918996.1 hypothetical protein [Pseudomonadota bacterium]
MAAETVVDQAVALGAMANTCGACHQSLETGPLLTELPAPAEGPGVGNHMAQHAWANDRMWAALIEPSTAAWDRSLKVLGPDSVPASDIGDWGLHEGSEELAAAVHELAFAALADDNPDTRADLYGQIVSQCASCHRASRGEPAL